MRASNSRKSRSSRDGLIDSTADCEGVHELALCAAPAVTVNMRDHIKIRQLFDHGLCFLIGAFQPMNCSMFIRNLMLYTVHAGVNIE